MPPRPSAQWWVLGSQPGAPATGPSSYPGSDVLLLQPIPGRKRAGLCSLQLVSVTWSANAARHSRGPWTVTGHHSNCPQIGAYIGPAYRAFSIWALLALDKYWSAMPTSPLQLCTEIGCGTLVAYGKCESHRLEQRIISWQRADSSRPSAAKRGYDTKWRAFRREYLLRHPACTGPACMALPFYLRPPATDVDHIDGLGPLGPHGFDEANLQALCHSCHSIKTNRFDRRRRE